MNELKKILGDADDNAFATAVSYMISAIIIACGIIMAAFILATAYVWGWVGFVSVFVLFCVTVIALACGRDE
jgi:hypothetical protein